MRQTTTFLLFSTLTIGTASAQTATIYGVIDEYLGYTNADGRGRVRSLDGGGLFASRLGYRGSEDLGNGYRANFALEQGVFVDTGGQADAARLFNRQSWVALSGGFGEARIGRQQTPAFYMLGSMDAFNGATYGSLLNNVSGYTPRFDNTIGYTSPAMAGLKLQALYSLGEQSTSMRALSASMLGAEFTSGPFWVGANHQQQRSADGSVNVKSTFVGGNYNYGKGRIYAGAYSGNNNGANLATNVPGRDYRAWSLSADYLVTGLLSIGALYGRADDRTASHADASQVSAIATYKLSVRTMLYTVATRLTNRNGAGFSLGAAAPITRNTPISGGDVSGLQFGVRHSF